MSEKKLALAYLPLPLTLSGKTCRIHGSIKPALSLKNLEENYILYHQLFNF
jgi:hypothetical protein